MQEEGSIESETRSSSRQSRLHTGDEAGALVAEQTHEKDRELVSRTITQSLRAPRCQAYAQQAIQDWPLKNSSKGYRSFHNQADVYSTRSGWI